MLGAQQYSACRRALTESGSSGRSRGPDRTKSQWLVAAILQEDTNQ